MPAVPPPTAGDAAPDMAALVPGLDAQAWGDMLDGLVGRAAGRAAGLTPTEVTGAAPRGDRGSASPHGRTDAVHPCVQPRVALIRPGPVL